MFVAVGGVVVSADLVRRWSGRALDPPVGSIFLEAPSELLGLSNPDDLWEAVAAAEPLPRRTFRDQAALDDALAGSGDASDSKTPWYMGDGAGHVAGPTRVSGTRPEGRTFDDSQVLIFVMEGDRVRSVDQYVGDPAAVTAFWS